ncbi:translation initiation factor IF-5A [Candidatus Pacearchaeota archaeon ex4484_26]|nr:MAG: translation initiation factor IF-5A [Candidatus Pacearchaeota archaeon ex4484_26]
METKFAAVTSLRKGSYIVIDDKPCIIKSMDISKTGKHGHAKARIEAIGLIDGQKRVIVKPGHENVPVPIIEKRRAQVLSINEHANIMDMETYETFSAEVDEEIKGQIKEGKQVEYWKISGKNIIKRVV